MSRFSFPDAPGDLIGAHISTKGGLHTVFERAAAIEATSIALFAKNSNQWKGKELTDDDVALFSSLRNASMNRAPILTHASYLINLATTNPLFHAKSIAAMIDELDRAERIGSHAVVLHPGAHLGAGPGSGLDQIARSLDQIHAAIPDHKVVTLLETAAGQGSCLGCTFEELGTIRKLVDDPQRVGICIDTCHIFAAGYELRTRDGYERTIDDLERHVGIEHVGAFHLNDSKKGLGSRVDRHQHIGEGELGLEPFRFVLNDPRFARIPKLLETPKTIETVSDQKNIAALRSLITKETPSPAPPSPSVPASPSPRGSRKRRS
ncbi:MAG TPA: deoxyribonuclease IV [Thermoanaerobaculia bacterium]|nr:deoxyribonuclease IV [Thermoanaerobaculia bacterium]